MKLLLFAISLLIPMQFAMGMLTVVPKGTDATQCKLVIDTATAPQDMLTILEKFNNPMLTGFKATLPLQHKDQTSEQRGIDLTLQMFESLEKYNVEFAFIMLGYLHLKNIEHKNPASVDYTQIAECIVRMKSIMVGTKK